MALHQVDLAQVSLAVAALLVPAAPVQVLEEASADYPALGRLAVALRPVPMETSA